MTRFLTWTTLLVTLLGTGSYVLIYLYRWEWHRALITGLFFLAAEIALVAVVLLRRLTRLELAVNSAPEPQGEAPPAGQSRDAQVLARLQDSRVERDHFVWLREASTRTNVFVPVLLGSGVFLSGLAWVIERVAGGGARSRVEGRLAERLHVLAFPSGPLVPSDGEMLAVGPQRDPDAHLRLLLGPGTAR